MKIIFEHAWWKHVVQIFLHIANNAIAVKLIKFIEFYNFTLIIILTLAWAILKLYLLIEIEPFLLYLTKFV